jgi:hypothetical protein
MTARPPQARAAIQHYRKTTSNTAPAAAHHQHAGPSTLKPAESCADNVADNS